MNAITEKILESHSLVRLEVNLPWRAELKFYLAWLPEELALLEVKLLHFYAQECMMNFLELFTLRTLGALYCELVLDWG